MSEFEDKLSAILGNPEAMGQIMALAQSLGGNSSGPSAPPPEAAPPTVPPAVQSPPPPSGGPDLSALLGGLMGGENGLDPRLLTIVSRIMQETGKDDDHRTALLQALRPFVKEQRYAKLDKAIQIARLSHFIRIGLDALKGGGTDV